MLNNADMPDAKKEKALWRKLQSEDDHAKIRQIPEPDAYMETTHAEVNREYGVTVKLEPLCRKLQNQTWRRESSSRRFDFQTVCRQTTSESMGGAKNTDECVLSLHTVR